MMRFEPLKTNSLEEDDNRKETEGEEGEKCMLAKKSQLGGG